MRMKTYFGMKAKINFIKFPKFLDLAIRTMISTVWIFFQSFLVEFDFNFGDLVSSCFRS
jgi:hypothetical protein